MVTDTLTSIDKQIGYFMVDKKITRVRMAELLGINVNTFRYKCNGKTPWKWDEIIRLSEITGKSIDELAGISKP